MWRLDWFSVKKLRFLGRNGLLILRCADLVQFCLTAKAALFRLWTAVQTGTVPARFSLRKYQ